jgi:hypothetical protein
VLTKQHRGTLMRSRMRARRSMYASPPPSASSSSSARPPLAPRCSASSICAVGSTVGGKIVSGVQAALPCLSAQSRRTMMWRSCTWCATSLQHQCRSTAGTAWLLAHGHSSPAIHIAATSGACRLESRTSSKSTSSPSSESTSLSSTLSASLPFSSSSRACPVSLPFAHETLCW